MTEFHIERKLQEQSGSYLIALPKAWVDAQGLKESDVLELVYNDNVEIKPAVKVLSRRKS